MIKTKNILMNGAATGTVASMLLNTGFDTNVLRPWINPEDGRAYITQNTAEGPVAMPVTNSNATLRKDEWEIIDKVVMEQAKPRLKLVSYLKSKGLEYRIPNGMAYASLATESVSDFNPAVIGMDPMVRSEDDRPEFGLVNLPLPIISKSFTISSRQLAISRNGNTPLDTTSLGLAARTVGEQAEKLTLGTVDAFQFGGGIVQGLTNYTNRITKDITAPTAVGWTPATFVSEVLAMRQLAIDANHFGPYALFVSTAWDAYLDEDYKANSDITLRERTAKLSNISDIVTLDYLTGYQVVLVQLDTNTIRIVNGMDVQTIQWESAGGTLLNFLVMAIIVPQCRKDFADQCGIVHGS